MHVNFVHYDSYKRLINVSESEYFRKHLPNTLFK